MVALHNWYIKTWNACRVVALYDIYTGLPSKATTREPPSFSAMQARLRSSGPFAWHSCFMPKRRGKTLNNAVFQHASNQRNILGSNIRRGNPVTQAGKSCFSLGIWMVFPWCVRGDTWLHAKHQHRNIREKVFTRSVLRLLAFSLQAISWAILSFLVLPWIWQMRELHASTLRWLTQLPFWRGGWKNQSENLRCRDQKDFSGLRNQQCGVFFEGGGACLMRRRAEFLQDFFFSTLTCAAQNSLPCVVPIHWRVVLWRLALLHNDPVSLARCKILAQRGMRNWSRGWGGSAIWLRAIVMTDLAWNFWMLQQGVYSLVNGAQQAEQYFASPLGDAMPFKMSNHNCISKSSELITTITPQ